VGGRVAANEQDAVSARTHRPRGGGASRGSAVVIRQRRRARTDARTCWLALRVHEALAASQPRQLRGALRRPYRMKHRSTNAPQSSLSPPPLSLLLPPLLLPCSAFAIPRTSGATNKNQPGAGRSGRSTAAGETSEGCGPRPAPAPDAAGSCAALWPLRMMTRKAFCEQARLHNRHDRPRAPEEARARGRGRWRQRFHMRWRRKAAKARRRVE